MAFTSPVTNSTVFGNKRVVFGTYASTAGSTGGAITTGLTAVNFFDATSATATPSSVITVSGGTATITTTANQTGMWMAIGV